MNAINYHKLITKLRFFSYQPRLHVFIPHSKASTIQILHDTHWLLVEYVCGIWIYGANLKVCTPNDRSNINACSLLISNWKNIISRAHKLMNNVSFKSSFHSITTPVRPHWQVETIFHLVFIYIFRNKTQCVETFFE